MTGFQNLSEFESGVIDGSREKRPSISEVAMKLGFSSMTISRVYREKFECDKTSNLRHRCGHKKIMQERGQQRLTRIIKRDKRVTLPQIAAYLNDGPSTSVPVQTIHRNIIYMGFRSLRLTHVPFSTAQHKALRLTGVRQHRH
ncbi:HTH_Tnp_Tc3_2 domain-containing protein [Trichonephila clavipes]|nr:HTH_Tnp_Tc3_2 domain-containing protein [Trichonephila clavipes]